MNTTTARFLASALALASAAALATDLHVAPGGHDANPGTHAKPFATPERARDAIRELKQTGPLKEPVTVRFEGGTYPLSREERFGPDDSGTAACPLGKLEQVSRGRAEPHKSVCFENNIVYWREGELLEQELE